MNADIPDPFAEVSPEPVIALLGTDHSTNPAVLQRALGAIIGAAVGDALGAPFEFGPPGRYSQTFPQPVTGGTGELIGGGAFGWAPGEFTDDTQMAVLLAESLLRRGGLDLDDLFATFAFWARTAADVGTTTSAALSQPSRRAAQAAMLRRTDHRAASNGALMRVFPLAVAFLQQDLDVTIGAALAQGALTHPPASCWGAAIGAALIRLAILGEDPFAGIEGLLDRLPPELAPAFAGVLDPAWLPEQGRSDNGSVLGCLGQAVWSARGAGSFADAVIRAIDLGGDTDTVACVAGALAGARFGFQNIPARWRTFVHGSVDTPSGTVRYTQADLQDLARRLLGGRSQGEAAHE